MTTTRSLWHAEALRLENSGLSMAAIARQLGRNYEAVKTALLRARGPTRKMRDTSPYLHEAPKPRANPFSAPPRPDQIAEARRLHAKRVPLTHIAASLHMTYATIRAAIDTPPNPL